MTITEIRKWEKGKSRICLNDEAAFWLYEKEIKELKLEEGQELTQEEASRIIREVIGRRAIRYAVSLLEKSDRTRKQLSEKLRQKEYPPEAVQEALSYVEERHYADDARFAAAYLRTHGSGKGKRQLELELLRKGVDRDDIERAWQELEETDGLPDEQEQIRKWLEKKAFRPEEADRREKDKMIRFLMGRGFGLEEIKKAFDRAN